MTFDMLDPDEVDETTGLPRVPEGYFWRVTEDSWGDAEVQLRRKRKNWFSEKISFYRMYRAQAEIKTYVEELDDPAEQEWDDQDPRDVLFIACRITLIELQDDLYDRRKRAELAALFGDYPPKRLELT